MCLHIDPRTPVGHNPPTQLIAYKVLRVAKRRDGTKFLQSKIKTGAGGRWKPGWTKRARSMLGDGLLYWVHPTHTNETFHGIYVYLERRFADDACGYFGDRVVKVIVSPKDFLYAVGGQATYRKVILHPSAIRKLPKRRPRPATG